MKMRIPTTEEWDKFMDVVCEDNSRSHWENILSWVNDSDFEKKYLSYRAFRGCPSARHWLWDTVFAPPLIFWKLMRWFLVYEMVIP